ncbi:MAG: methyltransferase [Terriglobales bacterium]
MAGSPAAIGNVAQNKALTEMAMGYSRSRVVCAAARLGVADALGDDQRSVDQLAALCGAQPASLYRLLRALASFGVVAERAPGRFVLTPLGKPLRKDAPNSEWAAIVFWADLLADSWSYLTECIRTGDNAMRVMEREGVASRWSKDPNAAAIFRAVMGTAPAEDYMPIARAWDFSKYRTVADLGGGGGALMAAVLEAFPTLQGMLVDRQESIDQARPRFESERLAARCKLLTADLCDSVPAGADVYAMKHVLHGYRDEPAIGILRNCRRVMPKRGRLLVIEFVLPDVVDHADLELELRLMSDLNMLAVTGGKERSAAEWQKLLSGADFECQGIIPVPGELVSIIEAAPRV